MFMYALHAEGLVNPKEIPQRNGIFRFFLQNLNVIHDLKIGQFLPFLATFYEIKSRFEKSSSRCDDLLKI
jgi:hypothetical protein